MRKSGIFFVNSLVSFLGNTSADRYGFKIDAHFVAELFLNLFLLILLRDSDLAGPRLPLVLCERISIPKTDVDSKDAVVDNGMRAVCGRGAVGHSMRPVCGHGFSPCSTLNRWNHPSLQMSPLKLRK